MFVMTARLNKRKVAAAAAAIIIAAAAVTAAVIIAGRSGGRVSAQINDAGDAAQYLTSLGWEISEKPMEMKEIVLPQKFDGVYADYTALQRKQGFRLEEYGGMKATRYTFAVNNYPTGESGIVADLIVCCGEVVAGDIQQPALNGFMEELKAKAPGGKKAK